jgi:dTDP-4-amino-4,6-dideoxygalactose transaminase
LGPEEERLVMEVLRSGQLAQGAYVERFEQAFASAHGVEHGVAVSSGTTALVAALQSLKIGPGDEVITSPFTFVATLGAILAVGATARFADIGSDYNVDPLSIEPLLNRKTRAIVPVHLYGQMADMTSISRLAASSDAYVVEDAAQAVGASYRGRSAGSFGLGCFSLYATKNLTTGEGGVVTTDDAAIAERLRLLRNHGMSSRRYEYLLPGYNYRMTNVAAAIGLAQIERLGEIGRVRRQHAATLRAGLADIAGLIPPETHEDREHVYHQYTVRVTPEAGLTRSEFVRRLYDRGVSAGIYYPRPVFDYSCFASHPGVVVADVPTARSVAEQVVSLPVHQHLTSGELDVVVGAVRSVLRNE